MIGAIKESVPSLINISITDGIIKAYQGIIMTTNVLLHVSFMSDICRIYVVFMSLIDFLHEPQDSESQIHKEETMSYVIKFYEIPTLKKLFHTNLCKKS